MIVDMNLADFKMFMSYILFTVIVLYVCLSVCGMCFFLFGLYVFVPVLALYLMTPTVAQNI
jgi:hypothetical protein